MTREKAIALLKALKNGLHETGKDFPYRDEVIPPSKEALDMAIKALEQEPSKGTPYIQAIYTEALEEGIRCAMCTNTIKSDTGCDGGCIVDAKMYNKVMTEINSRLLRQPPRKGYIEREVLDKIRAEISKAWHTHPQSRYEEGLKDQALRDMKIIDKYRTESEGT